MNLRALDEIRELIGAEQTNELLRLLAIDLQQRFERGMRRDDLAFDAHAVVSAAGLLGFISLADLCREVEEACRAGWEVSDLQARLDRVRRETIDQIAALRMAA
jgi:HPt (histidine-containing phosphotransfer) domain-containing protein